MISEALTSLIITLIILMGHSLLYRENPFYRILENAAIGLMLAFSTYNGIALLNNRVFTPIAGGNWMSGAPIAFILGLSMYLRFYEPLRHVSRLPIAFLTGIGMGVAVRRTVTVQILNQLPILQIIGVDPMTAFNNFIIVLAMVTTMSYYFFTYEHKGLIGMSAKLGRYFMMISFGTIMAFFAFDAPTDWTAFSYYLVTYPGNIVTALAFVLIAVDFIRRRT